ncbi:glycoside hydrolase family 92 protein [Trichoderma harzianum CBS 226.95]|uniref:Glycoside hydrolase family 92 protein n=1 Tax=Trichoderma harzianum CBS 226.95 TaxID=983964 RepID=A0A2T4A4U6_TRIHA|nr:glycoside hydrolase family 92 protein [Trichoderma harzianum CBS 226.95]PTB52058.1 glycoside hydrolase family 92 protein [Trichoderma harzianum CBS 226.95]
MFSLVVLGILAKASTVTASPTQHEDLSVYVNPFIGTAGPDGTGANSGDTFPGVSVPFGVVKLGPDTTEMNPSTNAFAGYTPDGNVTGFTCFHECGIGGASKYGVVGHMPLTTLSGVNVLDNATYQQPRVTMDRASVGYYRSDLANGVKVELAASDHAGFIQYTYPKNTERIVLFDVSHNLPSLAEFIKSQSYSNGQIEVKKNGKRVQGWGVWRGGWGGTGINWGIYFCNDFDSTPSTWQYFSGPWNAPDNPPSPSTPVTWGNASTDPNGVQGGPDGDDSGDRVGALFSFPGKTTVVKSKIGVSFISVEKACAFQSEVPSWTLNQTVQSTKKLWNDEVFSKISVKESTKNDTRLTLFYSALYRMHQMPSDRTGENPDWVSSEPYYDDYYTLWDTFRCLNSFYLLVQPQRGIDMIRSLIDIWTHVGFMPDGRSGNHNGKVQGGSNADNVLADAYVKGYTGGINWKDGYKAVWTDAEVVPPPNNDPEDASCTDNQGRCGLPDWINLGYVSTTFSSSISRTVEYSLNDFAVSQIAKGIAPHDYQKYLNRSGNWKTLWNPDINQYNTSGFLGPRYPNGTVITIAPQDTSYTTEGLPWEYTWTIPFDMQGLIDKMGGPDATEKRLDLMFVPNLRTVDLGVGVGSGTALFNPGNEPSFGTPFLYNYLPGRQYKAVNQSRVNIDENYFAGSNGLPGNSDAGAMDSWMLWQMLGLYPVVTQPVYLILAPWFEDISVSVGGSYTLRIKAKGLSNNSFFVQSLKVNGKAWNKSWLEHSDIAKGGLLEFVLGPEPKSWDTGAVPPSPGHQ